MTITRLKISERLVRKLNIKMIDSREIVDVFFEVISQYLENGKNIKISGFGNFILHVKNKRFTWNLKNKKKVLIAKRRTLNFKSSKKLKNEVEKNKNLKRNVF